MEDKTREEFEVWAKGEGYQRDELGRDLTGLAVKDQGYFDWKVQQLWRAWKHQSARIAELEADSTSLRNINTEQDKALSELEAQVQALRDDAERLDWLESSTEGHGFCHTSNGEYRHYAHQMKGFMSVRETIDAARAAKV